MSTTTIIRYLKSGSNFGWCKYDAQLEIEKSWASECKMGRIYPTLQRGEILQYDMDGKFIKEWSCRNEIYKQEGYYSSSITRCCLGKNKFAHGYMWFFKNGFKYEFVEERLNNMRRKHFKQSVNKYSLHGEYICTYDSISDAERKTGIPNTNISSCCNKKTHTAGGYIWRFADDNEYVEPFLNKHYKPVLQIDKNTNEVICIYSSISKASEETGINRSSISACCRCIRKSAGGYIWRYADDVDNIKSA